MNGLAGLVNANKIRSYFTPTSLFVVDRSFCSRPCSVYTWVLSSVFLTSLKQKKIVDEVFAIINRLL
jgi:hypothetical protein